MIDRWLMRRKPTGFGSVQWLTRAQIGDECPNLLPRGVAKLDAKAMVELKEWFGRMGKFPAAKFDPSEKIPR